MVRRWRRWSKMDFVCCMYDTVSDTVFDVDLELDSGGPGIPGLRWDGKIGDVG